MVDRLGVERPYDGELVHHLRGPGKELAHPRPALPGLGELEEAGCYREALLAGGHGGQALVAADGSRQLLAEHVAELRLVVPRIDLRRGAGREEPDGAPRLRAEVRQRGRTGQSLGEEP